MNKEYSLEKTILLSNCDFSGKLGVTGTLDLFLDIASLHEMDLGFDAITMKGMGYYWIIGKNRIRFLDRPYMLDRVVFRSWPLKPTRLFGNREYILEDSEGRPLVLGETEWLVATEGLEKLMPINDFYPHEIELSDVKLFEDKMRKVGKEFSESELIGVYTVRPTDVDFVGHMNNAAYSRAILSFISTEELRKREIRDVEIFYGLQCKEGDALSVYRRDIGGGAEFGAFLPDKRNVMTMRILFDE